MNRAIRLHPRGFAALPRFHWRRHPARSTSSNTACEDRKLVYAAVSSEANVKRLADIRGALRRLADPRKTPAAEARKLIADTPRRALLYAGNRSQRSFISLYGGVTDSGT
jgi:hypothetical protein